MKQNSGTFNSKEGSMKDLTAMKKKDRHDQTK